MTTRAVLLALAIGICAGASASFGATPPPSVKIEVIGKGKVSGTGINCGVGNLGCYAAYGTDPAIVTYTAAASSGWTFSHWEDEGLTQGCASPSCQISVTGDMTLTAVFTTTGVVHTATFGVSLGQSGTGTGAVTNGSTNYPIDCSDGVSPTTTCSVNTVVGSTLTVEETPDPGSFFAGWGGACGGSKPSCAIYLTGDQFASATFGDTSTNQLTVSVDGGGTVTGGGVNCGPGSTCDVQEPSTATVALTATPQSGYAFAGWGGDCGGAQPTCNVQMDTTRSVSASFVPVVPVLITVTGAGQVSGLGITCGPGPQTCNTGVAPDTTFQLTATPTTVGGTVSWGGCTSAAGTICSVSVGSSPVSITATFGGGTPPPANVTLSVFVHGDGFVQSMTSGVSIYCTAAGGTGCSATVQQNTSVTLAASPVTGVSSDFTGWSNDCSSSQAQTCTLTINGAKTATANFNGASTTYVLSAQVLGTGGGTITGAGLRCSSAGGTGCSSPEPTDLKATLSASPAAGSTFSGWGGACSGTGACTVTMTALRSVTATFAGSGPSEDSLAISVSGAGKVKATGGTCTSTSGKTVTCTQQYADGASVTLTATPARGFAFAGWKGACTGKKTSCAVAMTGDKTVTATFTRLALAAGHKPVVTKVAGGYRVVLSYTAGQAGTLRLVGVRAGITVIAHSKRVGAGAGKLAVVVKQHGRYRFTLTLASKSGKHALRWTVSV